MDDELLNLAPLPHVDRTLRAVDDFVTTYHVRANKEEQLLCRVTISLERHGVSSRGETSSSPPRTLPRTSRTNNNHRAAFDAITEICERLATLRNGNQRANRSLPSHEHHIESE